jgi:hypothetical protein
LKYEFFAQGSFGYFKLDNGYSFNESGGEIQNYALCPDYRAIYLGCGSGYSIAVFSSAYGPKINVDYNDGVARRETCYISEPFPSTGSYAYVGTNAANTDDPCL